MFLLLFVIFEVIFVFVLFVTKMFCYEFRIKSMGGKGGAFDNFGFSS